MKRFTIMMIGFVSIIYFLFFYPFHSVLQISNVSNGNILFCTKIENGEEFILSYIHSVNRRPVYDTIKVKGTHFIIVGSRFDSLGAGMPEASPDGNPIKFGKDGWLECIMNLPIQELTFFLGWVANHSIQFKNKTITLSEFANPGTLISLKVKKASYFEILRGRL